MHGGKEDGMEDGHPRFLNHDCGPVAECLTRNLSCGLFVVLLKVFTHCTFPYVHGSVLFYQLSIDYIVKLQQR